VQVDAGDRQSPSWTPFHGTDGTPNESVNDVLVRATGHERAVQDMPTTCHDDQHWLERGC
jgi:hypothetical protein